MARRPNRPQRKPRSQRASRKPTQHRRVKARRNPDTQTVHVYPIQTAHLRFVAESFRSGDQDKISSGLLSLPSAYYTNSIEPKNPLVQQGIETDDAIWKKAIIDLDKAARVAETTAGSAQRVATARLTAGPAHLVGTNSYGEPVIFIVVGSEDDSTSYSLSPITDAAIRGLVAALYEIEQRTPTNFSFDLVVHLPFPPKGTVAPSIAEDGKIFREAKVPTTKEERSEEKKPKPDPTNGVRVATYFSEIFTEEGGKTIHTASRFSTVWEIQTGRLRSVPVYKHAALPKNWPAPLVQIARDLPFDAWFGRTDLALQTIPAERRALRRKIAEAAGVRIGKAEQEQASGLLKWLGLDAADDVTVEDMSVESLIELIQKTGHSDKRKKMLIAKLMAADELLSVDYALQFEKQDEESENKEAAKERRQALRKWQKDRVSLQRLTEKAQVGFPLLHVSTTDTLQSHPVISAISFIGYVPNTKIYPLAGERIYKAVGPLILSREGINAVLKEASAEHMAKGGGELDFDPVQALNLHAARTLRCGPDNLSLIEIDAKFKEQDEEPVAPITLTAGAIINKAHVSRQIGAEGSTTNVAGANETRELRNKVERAVPLTESLRFVLLNVYLPRDSDTFGSPGHTYSMADVPAQALVNMTRSFLRVFPVKSRDGFTFQEVADSADFFSAANIRMLPEFPGEQVRAAKNLVKNTKQALIDLIAYWTCIRFGVRPSRAGKSEVVQGGLRAQATFGRVGGQGRVIRDELAGTKELVKRDSDAVIASAPRMFSSVNSLAVKVVKSIQWTESLSVAPEVERLFWKFEIEPPRNDQELLAALVELRKLVQTPFVQESDKGSLPEEASRNEDPADPWRSTMIAQTNRGRSRNRRARRPRRDRNPRGVRLRNNPLTKEQVSRIKAYATTKSQELEAGVETDLATLQGSRGFSFANASEIFPRRGRLADFSPERLGALERVDLVSRVRNKAQAENEAKFRDPEMRRVPWKADPDYIVDQAQLSLVQTTEALGHMRGAKARSRLSQGSTALTRTGRAVRLLGAGYQPPDFKTLGPSVVLWVSPPEAQQMRIMTIRQGAYLDADLVAQNGEGFGQLIGRALTATMTWLGEKVDAKGKRSRAVNSVSGKKKKAVTVYIGRVGTKELTVAWRPYQPDGSVTPLTLDALLTQMKANELRPIVAYRPDADTKAYLVAARKAGVEGSVGAKQTRKPAMTPESSLAAEVIETEGEGEDEGTEELDFEDIDLFKLPS